MTLPLFLYGGTIPFTPPPWTSTDDRLRGGSSRSSLTALPHNAARFAGHLDTTTLGGAGFAAQFSPCGDEDRAGASCDSRTGGPWDLSPYAGLEIALGEGDGKKYTLVLKDDTPPPGKSGGGGEDRASVSFEADFVVGDGVGRVWLPWEEFKATYRGKPVEEGGELKRVNVRRIGLMMRSFFGTQEGDFELEIKSLCAREKE